MTVDDMIGRILEKEGGYQAWPADKGNYFKGKLLGTNHGITPDDLAEFRRVSDLTREDMKQLEADEAALIFRLKYYERMKIERLPDVLEPAVFDFVVNSGAAGIKALQRTLNAFGHACDVDGGIGPQTVRVAYECLEDVPSDVFLRAYFEERREFLRAIVERRPNQGEFLNGWLNRVDALERELVG